MQRIPTDTIQIIITFLSLSELATTAQSYRFFNIRSQFRKKRLQWCQRKTINHRYIQRGKCVKAQCQRQRAYCIHLDPQWRTMSDGPLSLKTLSYYCSTHAIQYTGIDVLTL